MDYTVFVILILTLPGVISLVSLPGSCAEVRQQMPDAADGDYWIQLPGGSVARLNCHGMGDTNQEYIDLVAGEVSNYGSNYHTSVDATGMTYFHKVHLSVSNLELNITDRLFSRTEEGNAVIIYGHAGDCKEHSGWRVGNSEMNLTGTGFYFPDFTQGDYELAGWQPSFRSFEVSDSGEYVKASCTGGCGSCQPRTPLIVAFNPSLAFEERRFTPEILAVPPFAPGGLSSWRAGECVALYNLPPWGAMLLINPANIYTPPLTVTMQSSGLACPTCSNFIDVLVGPPVGNDDPTMTCSGQSFHFYKATSVTDQGSYFLLNFTIMTGVDPFDDIYIRFQQPLENYAAWRMCVITVS